MLANEGSDEPRQHIRTTARASWDDQFHRFLGFPGRDAAQPYERYRQYTYHRCLPAPLFHMVLLMTHLQCRTPCYFSRAARLFRLQHFPYLYARARRRTSQGLYDFSLRETRRIAPPRSSVQAPMCAQLTFEALSPQTPL